MKFRLHPKLFSIGGQDYRVIEKHPVIASAHEGNRVITITGSADLTMEIPYAKMPDTGSDSIPAQFDLQIDESVRGRTRGKEDSSFVEETGSMWKELVRNELIVNGRFSVHVKMTVKESAAVMVRI